MTAIPRPQNCSFGNDLEFNDLFESPASCGIMATGGLELTMPKLALDDDMIDSKTQSELQQGVDPEVLKEQEFFGIACATKDPTPLEPTQAELTNGACQVSLSDFELLSTIGVGAFGKVLQVRNKANNRIYALKVMSKTTVITKKAVEYINREKMLMSANRHPFIIALHCAFQTNGKLYLVMDFANGGPLQFHLQKESLLGEKDARFYISEMILAIEYLHNRDIVHRDLKPDNILIDHRGHVRLTDFGLAKNNVGENAGAKSFCGTDVYLAPEIIKGTDYGKAVDWWSLGAVAFDMMTGKPPFESKNIKQLYNMICQQNVKYPKCLTSEAISMLKGLLNRDPVERLEFARKLKKHKFFKGIVWESVLECKLTPPIKPNLGAQSRDLKNFSPTCRAIPITSSPDISETDQEHFRGFSFVRSPSSFLGPQFVASSLAASMATSVATPIHMLHPATTIPIGISPRPTLLTVMTMTPPTTVVFPAPPSPKRDAPKQESQVQATTATTTTNIPESSAKATTTATTTTSPVSVASLINDSCGGALHGGEDDDWEIPSTR